MDKEILLNSLNLPLPAKNEIRNLLNRNNISKLSQADEELIQMIGDIFDAYVKMSFNEMNEDIKESINDAEGRTDRYIEREVEKLNERFTDTTDKVVRMMSEIYTTKSYDRIATEIQNYVKTTKNAIEEQKKGLIEQLANLYEVLSKITDFLEKTRPINLRRDIVVPGEIRKDIENISISIGHLLRKGENLA